MTARRVNLLWLVSGLALIVLVVVSGWFTVISTKLADADAARDQAGETTARVAQLRGELAKLAAENEKLDTYTAEVATYQAALPSEPAVPAFLTALQNAGTRVDVRVSGLTVAGPEQSKALSTAWQLPISLTAEGTAANLSRFLVQLQDVQSRAVLIKSANLATSAEGSMSLALSLTAFVAPPAGAGAPVVTTQ